MPPSEGQIFLKLMKDKTVARRKKKCYNFKKLFNTTNLPEDRQAVTVLNVHVYLLTKLDDVLDYFNTL